MMRQLAPRPRFASALPWFAGVMLFAVTLGCANTRVSLSELPEHPIAIVFWEPEAARRLAEGVTKAAEQRPQQLGVARLEQIGALLGVYDPRVEGSLLARFPGHLSLVHPRTGEVEKVDAATPGSRPLAWSSDGKRLLFASAPQRGRNHLFEYELESRLVRRLASDGGSSVAAAYGPDRRVVFASVKKERSGSRSSIFVTGPYGASPQILSEGVSTDALAWSPVGSPILFVRRESHGSKMRPMLVARALTSDSEERVLGPGRDPVFTPDGDWIVYSGPVKDGWRLRRMRPDGSGRTRVGTGTRDELQPAVSPGSSHVAYISRDQGDVQRLYVRRMDGSGDRMLIRSGGAASPVW